MLFRPQGSEEETHLQCAESNDISVLGSLLWRPGISRHEEHFFEDARVVGHNRTCRAMVDQSLTSHSDTAQQDNQITK